MPVFAYSSGTVENDELQRSGLPASEAASGKIYSLGNAWELVVPVSYRFSPLANLTLTPKMFWIRRSVAFDYNNTNEPEINYRRSETQYDVIPSVSFGVEIGEKSQNIHPEATLLFIDGKTKFFLELHLSFNHFRF